MDEHELKTVGADSDDTLCFADPLLKEQQRQISQMRDTLLSFDKDDIHSAKNAIQSITVMRIYHQVGRIIKFTEMMDRIEDRLYESIDYNLAQFDTMDPQTMMMLLQIQKQLQDTMIESQKLIQPYMNIDFTSIAPVKETEANSFGAAVIDQDARSRIRESAQAVLTVLTNEPTKSTDINTEYTIDGQMSITDLMDANPTNSDSVAEKSAGSTEVVSEMHTVSQSAAEFLASVDGGTPLNDSEVPF